MRKNIKMKKYLNSITSVCLMTVSLGSCSGNDDTAGTVPPPPASEVRPEYELVFEENFDGNAVDESKWLVYDFAGHNNNGLRSPIAVTVEDGLLVITAKMIDVDGQPVLHSGAIAHRQNYMYGKFEFKVKADRDPSGVMSAVVLTWPQSEDWPNDGENDIYETHEANIERDHFTSNIMSGLPLNKWSNKSYNIDATEWHTVAMEWQETAIRIYIDDVLRWRLTDPKDFCHTPHHLCIQLDAFAQEMTGETRMYVDWVKIYQEKKSEE